MMMRTTTIKWVVFLLGATWVLAQEASGITGDQHPPAATGVVAEEATTDSCQDKSKGYCRLPNKMELVQFFAGHKTGINYVDLCRQVKKFAFCGDIYGLDHGTMGSIMILVPFRFKGATIAPGVVALIGRHETGPGAVVRWEYCTWYFCTEGTAGFFRPFKDSAGPLQFLGDPMDADLAPFSLRQKSRWQNLKFGYSGEFGRYGKFGLDTDRIHGIQTKIPLRQGMTLTFSFVPAHLVGRAGFVWTFGSKR